LLSQIEELMSLVEERENDRLVGKLWEIAGAGERGSGGAGEQGRQGDGETGGDKRGTRKDPGDKRGSG